jgi:uncharacterized membrane protein YvbJ
MRVIEVNCTKCGHENKVFVDKAAVDENKITEPFKQKVKRYRRGFFCLVAAFIIAFVFTAFFYAESLSKMDTSLKILQAKIKVLKP